MLTRRNSLYFLLGLVLSLAALSLLGSMAESSDLARNFVRFHSGIGLEFNYFATANDIRSIIAPDPADKAKITVIVGGDSVLFGETQKEPVIWTQLLQKKLGDNFRVINLARRGGALNEFGNIATEMLLAEGRPVIYLCNTFPVSFGTPVEHGSYQRTVFNAWQQGYLLDWPARDRKLRTAYWSPMEKFRENAWGALLDRFLYFDEFWNYVAYEHGQTVWNKWLALDSARPLRLAPDGTPDPEWYKAHRYPGGAENQEMMEHLQVYLLSPDDPGWQTARSTIRDEMPSALRAKSLIGIDLISPHYRRQFTTEDQDRYASTVDTMAALLKDEGFHQVFLLGENFDEDDYSDAGHLSVVGGQKLAERLAPEIVKMTAELGYQK